jgi:alkanesulfonate monooxygenase SsuD/methylene tetrahydromethanopterin reductase-like flavin-dependent oxidoreductase (luciferase family)
MPFALSVSDLSPIPSRSKDSEALWNTLDLAQRADELGYHRYWLAEHHSMIDLGSTAPEIMIGQIESAAEFLIHQACPPSSSRQAT